MVARENGQGRPASAAAGLAHAWRALLTSILHPDRRRPSVPSQSESPVQPPQTSTNAEPNVEPTVTRPALLSPTMYAPASLGVTLFVIGAGARIGVGVASGEGLSVATGIVTTVIWAGVRLILMRLTPSLAASSRLKTPVLTRFWAAGLAPYVLAVLPETRLVAWVASAWLTRKRAIESGVSRAHASRMIGVAWGFQAGLTILGWLGKSILILLLGASA